MTSQQYRTQCLAEAERLCLSDITQDEYEAGARKLVEKLTSAQAEYERRRSDAQQWFNARINELAALSQAGGE
jgi:predicted nucleic acid-binding protein